MIAEYRKMWEARNWMKRNEPFLPTWQAYVGYRLDLFEKLAGGATIESLVQEYGYEENLLRSWADAGVVLGHLKKEGDRLIPSKKMLKFFSQKSDDTVGELLKELFEMHMPALMNYPSMIESNQKGTFNGDDFSKTVAATSALIEKRAFGHVLAEMSAQKPHWVLDIGCGTGGYLMKLAKKMNQGTFVGVDISKDCVEEAREKAMEKQLDDKVKFYYADINTWDVPNGLFDVVMMNNLLHYYSPDARGDLFTRVAELVSKRGTVIVITPLYLEKGGQRFSAAFNSFMEAHDNLHPLPQKEALVQDAASAGLKLKSVKTVVREGSWYCMSFSKK
ncbi:class I SAM-dependent methyltransferase [Domibacillus enclensis]|uniref:Methyltransferase domain-containing protein n=1 Tax=Domibacillus enclensis TaxID=1017273 RepID=A0A1N7CU39_9BACI|nr:class I SAM-dependent methyltransferase [Domibacillus enclensis]OXS73289.1 SAM-dependent methyltransferase [Domibacillus enclensis]SIR67060.1 Methyltransferase domain-containing protein [Domibacillus enclensis]